MAFNIRFVAESPLSLRMAFESPSYAATGSDASVTVIDKSKTRVSVLNESGAVCAVLHGGNRRESSFYNAEFAVSDGQSIYVADVLYAENGPKVQAERLLRYSLAGRYLETLWRADYSGDAMPLQRGNLRAMALGDDGPQLAVLAEGAVELYTGGAQGDWRRETLDISAIEHPFHAALAWDSRQLAISDKQGILYEYDDGAGGFLPSMDWSQSEDAPVYGEFAFGGGQLFGAELAAGQVLALPQNEAVYGHGDGGTVYRLHANSQGDVTFTDNQSVFRLGADGAVLLAADTAPCTAAYYVRRAAVWLALAALAAGLVVLAARLVAAKVRGGVSQNALVGWLVSGAVVLTSAAVILSQAQANSHSLEEKGRSSLLQTAQALSDNSGITFGDAFTRLQSLRDYGSADYAAVRSYLDPYCESAYENGANLYYILYRVQGNTVYGVLDYEDTIGTLFPYEAYDTSSLQTVCGAGETFTVEASADSYGYWMFVQVPVYNSSGQIVGALELGTDLKTEMAQNQKQIGASVATTAILLLNILLLVTTGTHATEAFSALRQKRRGGGRDVHVVEMVHPLTFLVFFADNTCAAFIPQLSEGLFLSSAASVLPAWLGPALPMSLQLLFIAVLGLMGGRIIDRQGPRKTMLGGVALQLAGYVLAAVAIWQRSYLLLLLAEAIMGSGSGLAIVALNTLPATAEDPARRSHLFSQLNVGLVAGVVLGTSLGAYLADFLGHASVFLLSALLALAVGFLVRRSISSAVPALPQDTAAEPAEPLDTKTFLRTPTVFSFLLFAMLPFLTMMYFKDYVFPLFAGGAGHSDTMIGNILLLAGAVSIYFGPPLTDFFLRRVGNRGTVVLASALMIASLLLFAALNSFGAAVAAVVLLGLASSFGLAAQGVYYTSLPVVRRYGTGKAMGVYGLCDNIGQAAGPLVYAALLVLGYRLANLMMGGAALGLLLLFALLGRRAPNTRDKTHVTDKEAQQ